MGWAAGGSDCVGLLGLLCERAAVGCLEAEAEREMEWRVIEGRRGLEGAAESAACCSGE